MFIGKWEIGIDISQWSFFLSIFSRGNINYQLVGIKTLCFYAVYVSEKKKSKVKVLDRR